MIPCHGVTSTHTPRKPSSWATGLVVLLIARSPCPLSSSMSTSYIPPQYSGPTRTHSNTQASTALQHIGLHGSSSRCTRRSRLLLLSDTASSLQETRCRRTSRGKTVRCTLKSLLTAKAGRASIREGTSWPIGANLALMWQTLVAATRGYATTLRHMQRNSQSSKNQTQSSDWDSNLNVDGFSEYGRAPVLDPAGRISISSWFCFG